MSNRKSFSVAAKAIHLLFAALESHGSKISTLTSTPYTRDPETGVVQTADTTIQRYAISGHGIEANATVAGGDRSATLLVTVTKKPFFIPYGAIWAGIEDGIADAEESIGVRTIVPADPPKGEANAV